MIRAHEAQDEGFKMYRMKANFPRFEIKEFQGNIIYIGIIKIIKRIFQFNNSIFCAKLLGHVSQQSCYNEVRKQYN